MCGEILPMVMFVRILVSQPPAWQVLLSIGIQALSVLAFTVLSARIFRVGILMTGRRFRLAEILRRRGNVYPRLSQSGDLFLPVNHRWRERLIELGCEPGRIVVHHMGIDAGAFEFAPRRLEGLVRERGLDGTGTIPGPGKPGGGRRADEGQPHLPAGQQDRRGRRSGGHPRGARGGAGHRHAGGQHPPQRDPQAGRRRGERVPGR